MIKYHNLLTSFLCVSHNIKFVMTSFNLIWHQLMFLSWVNCFLSNTMTFVCNLWLRHKISVIQFYVKIWMPYFMTSFYRFKKILAMKWKERNSLKYHLNSQKRLIENATLRINSFLKKVRRIRLILRTFLRQLAWAERALGHVCHCAFVNN